MTGLQGSTSAVMALFAKQTCTGVPGSFSRVRLCLDVSITGFLFCFHQSLSPAFLTSFYVNSGALLAESESVCSAALWLLDSTDLKLVHGDPDTHHSLETTRELCREGHCASKQPE